jgi:hypothetical protein
LYDLRKDPDCLTNLAGRVDFRPFKRQLFDELKAQDDPRVLGTGRVFDEYPHAHEAFRGFYERYLKGEKIKVGWVNETDFEK